MGEKNSLNNLNESVCRSDQDDMESDCVNWPKFKQKLTLIRCVWFGESYIFRPLKMKRIYWIHCVMCKRLTLTTHTHADLCMSVCICVCVCVLMMMMLLLPLFVSLLRSLCSPCKAWVQWNTRPNMHTHTHTHMSTHEHTRIHVQLTLCFVG